MGLVPLAHFGVPAVANPGAEQQKSGRDISQQYVIGAHWLHEADGRYEAFLHRNPVVARIGWSMRVYCVQSNVSAVWKDQ